MNWTTPAAIREQLLRQWTRLLTAKLRGEEIFPLTLPLKKPDARACSERFEDVRRWIAELEAGSKPRLGYGYDVEWADVRHRELGSNRLPVRIVVSSEPDALRLTRKTGEAALFDTLTASTVDRFPVLLEWILRRPLKLLEHAEYWDKILAVLAWRASNPSAGSYVRQLGIPGVDTKFIERHRGLFSELFDLVLPAAIAGPSPSFEERFGFTAKPALIRFRILDDRLALAGLTDLSVPLSQFVQLNLPAQRVFIAENELSGLTFPSAAGAIAVFGLGYSVTLLSQVHWLEKSEVHYWGDIDTHGFVMLDRLRATLPAAKSFLMDRATLLAHRELWGEEPQPSTETPTRLTGLEQALFDDLRYNALGHNVRLEQERISGQWVEEALRCAGPL